QGAEYATFTKGSMTFAPDGTVAAGKQFLQMPRIPLPDGTVKFRWYGVPLRYIISPFTFFERYRLRVNQFPFWVWPAGSLLYVDYTFQTFTPPVPGLSPFMAVLNTSAKLVDIEFTFAHTSRQPAGTPGTPANTNYLAAGWNLQPHYEDMLFHYPTTDGSISGQ